MKLARLLVIQAVSSCIKDFHRYRQRVKSGIQTHLRELHQEVACENGVRQETAGPKTQKGSTGCMFPICRQMKIIQQTHNVRQCLARHKEREGLNPAASRSRWADQYSKKNNPPPNALGEPVFKFKPPRPVDQTHTQQNSPKPTAQPRWASQCLKKRQPPPPGPLGKPVFKKTTRPVKQSGSKPKLRKHKTFKDDTRRRPVGRSSKI